MAMVFEEIDKPFSSYQINLPTPSSGEVLVKIDLTTICTSDLHTYYGRRISPCPSILGHEIMGTVINVSQEGVFDYLGTPVKPGDRITWSVYAYDENDPMAMKGYPQKSSNLYKYGHEALKSGEELNGGFATHCMLSKGTSIHRVTGNLSDRLVAPINCSHATMAGALRLAGSVKDKKVAVIGTGMLGLSSCAMLKEGGASQLIALDINTKRLQKAREFGVDKGIDVTESFSEWKEVIERTGGLDVVIDTSGDPQIVENCISLLNIGGICVIVGAVYTQRDLSVNAEKIVRNLLTIKGLHNYIPQDLANAITFIQQFHDKYPFESLIGAEFPLDKLDEAFELAELGGAYRVGVRP